MLNLSCIIADYFYCIIETQKLDMYQTSTLRLVTLFILGSSRRELEVGILCGRQMLIAFLQRTSRDYHVGKQDG